eukprot:5171569-Prymnesium_polylepis.1
MLVHVHVLHQGGTRQPTRYVLGKYGVKRSRRLSRRRPAPSPHLATAGGVGTHRGALAAAGPWPCRQNGSSLSCAHDAAAWSARRGGAAVAGGGARHQGAERVATARSL